MVSKSSVLACFRCKPFYHSCLDPLPSPAPQQQVIKGRSFRQPPNHHKSKPETVWQDPSPSNEKHYLKSPHGEDHAAIVSPQQCHAFLRVEQKHSMAIAAATAVAAEAAVVAAQAAAEVAWLTSGRHCVGGQSNEEWAALKIQGAFRGYLAQRALRALKGLVWLQALFRGYSVRKQTISTLCSMQALARVQTCMRSKRVLTGVDRASQSELLQKHQLSPWKKPATKPETVVVGEGTKHQGWSWLDRENQKNKLRRIMESEIETKGGSDFTKLRPGNVRQSPNWNDGHTRRAPLVEKSAKRTAGVNSSAVNPGLNKPRVTSTNNYACSSSPCSFRTWDDHSYASGSSSTPNYMMLTESARAKFRSRSSPKKSPVSPVQREYFYHLRDALHF